MYRIPECSTSYVLIPTYMFTSVHKYNFSSVCMKERGKLSSVLVHTQYVHVFIYLSIILRDWNTSVRCVKYR